MDRPVYLSVIVPCYNGENTLETTIQSILSQNRSEIELIIVNDGSDDNTELICRKYEHFDTVRYFYIENSGAGYARNFGITKANGTWISFLDADDLFLEDCIDKVIPVLHEYEKQGIEVIYTTTTRGDMQLNNPIVRHAEQIDEICHIPQYEFWSCFYLKDFLNRKNIKFFEYREQDVETAFRYRVFSNSPRGVTDNNLSFYFQRINPNSNTHTWKEDVLHRIKSRVYLELLEENVQESEDAWLLEVALKEVSKFYLHCIKYGCVDKASIDQVNATYKRAIKRSRTISKDKKMVLYLIASNCFRILGNTLGRRASQ